MLTIRIDNETKEMIAYLRLHKVRFQPDLRKVMKAELARLCNNFKMEPDKEELPF